MAMSAWWTFSKDIVAMDHDKGGVYELGNADEKVVYIGSSGEVKSRLQDHLSGSDLCITLNANKYRLEYRSDYKAEEATALQRAHSAVRRAAQLQRQGTAGALAVTRRRASVARTAHYGPA